MNLKLAEIACKAPGFSREVVKNKDPGHLGSLLSAYEVCQNSSVSRSNFGNFGVDKSKSGDSLKTVYRDEYPKLKFIG